MKCTHVLWTFFYYGVKTIRSSHLGQRIDCQQIEFDFLCKSKIFVYRKLMKFQTKSHRYPNHPIQAVAVVGVVVEQHFREYPLPLVRIEYQSTPNHLNHLSHLQNRSSQSHHDFQLNHDFRMNSKCPTNRRRFLIHRFIEKNLVWISMWMQNATVDGKAKWS